MRLLEFLDNISLTENRKTRYMSMIQSVPHPIQDTLEQKLDWALKTLKREDRVIWFMRWARLESMFRLYNEIETNDANKEQHQWIDKEINKIAQKGGHSPDKVKNVVSWNPTTRLKTQLEHFMAMNIPEIEQFQFQYQLPSEVIDYFEQAERHWQEQLSDQYFDMDEDTDAEVMIDFGDGTAWWDLNRSKCDDEADAMGHCGNRYTNPTRDDTILSFRVYDQQSGGWAPRLTFILDRKNGMLGEMKGRANEKPAERYHPYIIELLKHPRVQGIVGGGYEADKNFAISDLKNEQAVKQLLDMKPQLGSLSEIRNIFGMGEKVDTKLKFMAEESGLPVPKRVPDSEGYFLENENNIFDFVEEWCEDNDTKRLVEIIRQGEYAFDVDPGDIPVDMIEDLLSDVVDNYPEHAKMYTTVAQHYIRNNSELAEVFDENSLTASDILEIIEEQAYDVYLDLMRSTGVGIEHGMEAEMYNDFMRWIYSPDNNGVITLKYDDFDSEVSIYIDDDALVEEITNNVEQFFDAISWANFLTQTDIVRVEGFEEPRHGWQGYDKVAAMEHLTEIGDELEQEYERITQGETE